MNLDYLARVFDTAYTLLPPTLRSPEATRMLYAIGWQESRFAKRVQVDGPARGFWQFEQSGVAGVLKHPFTQEISRDVLRDLCYPTPVAGVVHPVLAHNDVLAACFARLLLRTDMSPLPASAAEGWEIYRRTWRPGRPRPETWDDAWAFAVAKTSIYS